MRYDFQINHSVCSGLMKRYIVNNGTTLRQAASEFDTSHITISRIIRGKEKTFGARLLAIMADKFELQITDFYILTKKG